MSGVVRTVGVVAGVVALAASVAVTAGATAPILGASLASIATAAGAAAGIANIAAGALATKPPARGSVSQTTIGTDQPTPFILGRTYYAGARQHLTGYGPTIKKVPNPYLLAVDVYSGAGPVDGLEATYADFTAIPFAGSAAGGYFSGFLWRDTQPGLCPEPDALAPHWPGAPGWGAASKLSSYAAIAWSALFDRDGKVFASGLPQLGAVWRGVRSYDPRRDSTYRGGDGPQRINDRTTWGYSECPGLIALSYAAGHYHAGVKLMGVGMPADGIRIADFVHLANVCDANGWKVGGVIFEPANRWTNLKDILAAGGAEPVWVGGQLGVKVSAPRVALDTITMDDLATPEISVGAMRGWEERLNTLVPKYRSEQHKWEYVQAAKPVTVASYVAEDGEEKREERQLNLVQDPDQAAQLCAYELVDRRELGEIEITCKPRLRRYGAGDLVIVDLPEAGLVMQPCVILKRTLDAGEMTVSFVLRGETPGKHAYALGQTGIAPPTPQLRATAELDGLAADVAAPGNADAVLQLAIAGSFTVGLRIKAANDGTITISDHVRRYADGHPDVAISGATLSGYALNASFPLGYDDPDRVGGSVTVMAYGSPTEAGPSPQHPGRHFVAVVTMPPAGAPPATGGGEGPPWWKFPEDPAPPA